MLKPGDIVKIRSQRFGVVVSHPLSVVMGTAYWVKTGFLNKGLYRKEILSKVSIKDYYRFL